MPAGTKNGARPGKGRGANRDADLPISERREAILAIAADIFAQKGFVATTVREIADAAGILSGSLYHHFDSKETMIDEIVSGFIDEMVEDYTAIVEAHDDPLEALKALIRRAFDALQPHRAALTVAQNESHYLRQFERFRYLDEGYAQVERLWSSVLEAGIRSGAFRADLDTKLVYLFIRDAVWVTVRWYQPDGRYSTGELAATYTDLVLGGIAAPAPARSRGRSTRR